MLKIKKIPYLFGKKIINVVEGLHAQRQKRNKKEEKKSKDSKTFLLLLLTSTIHICVRQKKKKEAKITGPTVTWTSPPSVPIPPTLLLHWSLACSNQIQLFVTMFQIVG